MKAISSVVCAVTICLLTATVQAQINCEVNLDAARLLDLLRASPTDQCRTQMLNIVGVDDFVAQAEVVFQALTYICEPVCLEYVRMVAQECLPSYVTLLGLACGKNEQAIFCYQTIALNNGSALVDVCYPTFPQSDNTTDASNTTEVLPVTSSLMCSNTCRNALEDFRAIHGCCVTNAFNTTAFGLLTYGIANYTLWSGCEVKTVQGTCASPFVDTTPMPTDSSYTPAAHGVLSLLAVLMAFLLIVY